MSIPSNNVDELPVRSTEIASTAIKEHFDGGVVRLTQHMRPVHHFRNGLWRAIDNQLGNSGDPELSVGVDELLRFRLRPNLLAGRPVLAFAKGDSHVTITPLGINEVDGQPVGNNGWGYENAWNGADLGFTVAGHFVRKVIRLWAGHPTSFAFRVEDEAGMDTASLRFGNEFRILDPYLEHNDYPAVIPLTWTKSLVNGKLRLRVDLPPPASSPTGSWVGWRLDPTLTLEPNAADGLDASVWEGGPTSNFGTGILWIGSASSVTQRTRTFIKFNLSALPSNAILSSTTLSLYANFDRSTVARIFRVFRVKRAWVEAQVTWNRYSTGNDWQTAGGFGTGDCEQTDIGIRAFTATETLNVYKDFVLTPTTKADLDLGNGFLIKADTEIDDRYDFNSSDSASNQPKLVIVYTEPSGRGVFIAPFTNTFPGAFGL